MTLLEHHAAAAGHDAARLVASGELTEEQAGDRWVLWADRSHGAGVAFTRAYEYALG